MNKKRRLVLAVTGASGSIYARLLIDRLDRLREQIDECFLVFSDNARAVWEYELGHFDENMLPYKVYSNSDYFAPFASGSAGFDCMIICPCSMGAVGRIANGVSNDLISRSADVILKERKHLILTVRETPFSQIHLRNMLSLTEAGAVICPACPSFYSKPADIEAVVSTVVDRLLQLAGFEFDRYRWGS